jgi:hypothetical protein
MEKIMFGYLLETVKNLPIPFLFNTTTKAVYRSSANTTSLPTMYYAPASVSDGRYGYLIGGLGSVEECGSHRVNMDDASTEFLPVAKFLAGDGSHFDFASVVFVNKLNRIYIFGGYTDNGTGVIHDSFWYIKSPSLLITAFDCSNLRSCTPEVCQCVSANNFSKVILTLLLMSCLSIYF